MPLTDATLRNLKSLDRTIKSSDGGGLFIQVEPGGSKLWRLAYRFEGKQKLLSLGRYPEVSLKDARAKRDEAKKQLAAGIDPSEARKAAKLEAAREARNSFEVVARAWMETQRPKWTPQHAINVQRRLEKDIFPVLRAKPIGEIKPLELLSALKAIEERGNKDLPGRVRATCGQVFEYGIIMGLCENNPAVNLRKALVAHPVQHQLALSPQDLPELLRKIETYDSLGGGDLQTKLGLKLLALTFVRTSELILATWEEFAFDKSEWRIPAERMKMRAPHIVPLSRQALEILSRLREMNGEYPWVFAGRMPQRPMSNNTLLYALYRLGFKGRMTGHGFRAVASTMLNEMGFRPDVIERQLAHKERNEVRAAYHRSQYLEDRRVMMQQWANNLDALREGAEVFPLRRKA